MAGGIFVIAPETIRSTAISGLNIPPRHVGEADGHSFTKPSVTVILYDEGRSAVMHGGEVPEVTETSFGFRHTGKAAHRT